MPAPPKNTDGDLRTFGSPPPTGDLRDGNPLIGAGLLLGAGAGLTGLKIRERNDKYAKVGNVTINNAMADQWTKVNFGTIDPNSNVRWAIQDLFSPDPKVRLEAAEHVKTLPTSTQDQIRFNNAIEAGESWNQPLNKLNPDQRFARNNMQTQLTADAALSGLDRQQTMTNVAGQVRQNTGAMQRWAQDTKRGSVAPKPTPSTWTGTPVATRMEPELISSSERGRYIQAGKPNSFTSRDAENAAFRQQTAQAFEQSPFAKTMEVIATPVRKLNAFADRLVPENIRGTWKGGALKGGASMALATGASMLAENVARNAGRGEVANVKAADEAAAAGLGPANNTPGSQAAKKNAAQASNITGALKTLSERSKTAPEDITPWFIKTVEETYGLPTGTLKKYMKK